MKQIPETKNSLVLRTDFSDDKAWKSIRSAIRKPVWEFQFQAYVDFVSDPDFADLSVEQACSLVAESSRTSFFFIVDQLALTHPDRPILVVGLRGNAGRSFRVIPSKMWSVENNLSLGNMDFHEFADDVDDDGIFRGFPE